jgi:MoaE-MoaD fusion protein
VNVRIRLFAQQRQLTGWRERTIALPDGSLVSDAWKALVVEWPVLAAGTGSVRFARNAVYADVDEPLSEGDEVAVIPPVAGGAGGAGESTSRPILELHADPFTDAAIAALRTRISTPADGAVVLFVGQTRESPGTPAPGEESAAEQVAGESVEELEYEAFEEMALRVFAQIADEILARFGVQRLAILHRTGQVPLGEASVIVAAAAAHRGAAFDAARYAIDELKARAPIWKSEHFEGGSVWVGTPARHGPQTTTAGHAPGRATGNAGELEADA